MQHTTTSWMTDQVGTHLATYTDRHQSNSAQLGIQCEPTHTQYACIPYNKFDGVHSLGQALLFRDAVHNLALAVSHHSVEPHPFSLRWAGEDVDINLVYIRGTRHP